MRQWLRQEAEDFAAGIYILILFAEGRIFS